MICKLVEIAFGLKSYQFKCTLNIKSFLQMNIKSFEIRLNTCISSNIIRYVNVCAKNHNFILQFEVKYNLTCTLTVHYY